ncbi:MAG: hypothetical protein GXO66_05975 [Euryarchaeota archaeon]|nr:hypothetical protein [Euryarchaeota archaeon]
MTSRKRIKVATVARKKARKLAVVEEDMISACHGRIKFLWLPLLLLTVSAGCNGEELTYYRWQHDDYLARVYADMDEIGRLNGMYAAGEVEYAEYARGVAAALDCMTEDLVEYRKFLRENGGRLQEAGINLSESDAWAVSQLLLAGEVAREVAGKLEARGYRGETLAELRRIEERAAREATASTTF